MGTGISNKSFRGWCVFVSVTIAVVMLLGANMTGLFSRFQTPVANAAGGGGISVRAAGRGTPSLSLQDGRALKVNYAGSALAKADLETGTAQPLALDAYDFDTDGAQDLVAGYATERGGLVVVHRGNLEAYGPTNPETIRQIAQGVYPSPFIESAFIIEMPESPDFLTTGDFDRDGWPDILATSRGSHLAYLLAGDGRQNFSSPRAILLPGAVTTMKSGFVGDSHAQPDVVLGLTENGRNKVYVYGGPTGILGESTSWEVSGEVTSMALGRLGNNEAQNIVAVAGGELVILRRGGEPQKLNLPFIARSVAVGEFVRDRDARAEIAVLAVDGSVNVLAREDLDTRPMTRDEIIAKRIEAAEGRSAPPISHGPVIWKIVESMPMAAGAADNATIVRAHLSTEAAEDLLVLDPSKQKIHVLSAPTLVGEASKLSFAAGERIEAAFDVADTPVAVLPMRVGVDGRQGMVMLGKGNTALTVVPQSVAATFTVTKTADTNDGTCDADCSLREAITAANNSPGADMITFGVNGTFQLTIAGRNENANATGDLDITQALTIVGNGATNTIIQAGTNATNGIDKVMSFNPNFTTPLAASISGVTIQFGFNNSSPAGDGFGGALDQEFNATGSLSITNCVITSNTSVNGPGGAGGFTSTGGTNGVLLVSGSTISSNLTQANFGGGGFFIGTGTQVQSTNTTFQSNQITGTTGSGGGVSLAGSPNPASRTFFHNNVFTGNQATVDGGGIFTTQPILLDQSSEIFSNTAGRFGGGVWINHSNASSTIDHCTIRNNIATAAGGGVRLDSSATNNNLTMNFCRVVDNTAPIGIGLSVLNGAASVENNWWGCNGGPTAPPCDTAVVSGTGTLDFTPWITLSHTASPSTILRGQATTLTASFLQNSAGTALTTTQISELIGLPITFNGAVNGTISNAQMMIQANGTATASFTGTAVGTGTADAVVDGFTATANITIQNNPPTIVAGGKFTRQQGSPGTTSQIATVSDPDQNADTLTVTATPPAGITVTGIAIDSSGNVTANIAALCAASLGNNTVNLTVTDSNGGSASATFTVSVTANTPPTVGTYPNTSVNAGMGTTITPSAAPSDNVTVMSVTAVATSPAGFTGTLTGDPLTGVITVANANAPNTYTITVTVTDNCNATVDTTFQLTVIQPCVITCPSNITVSNDANQCNAVVTYTAPSTTGNCGTVNCTPPSGSAFPKGTTSVNCTTKAGPSCSFTVTVNDTQKPQINCPAVITATIPTGSCVVVNYPPPVATDNCPGVSVNCVPPSGSCFPLGTTTVTCTATDASGNQQSCSFAVTTFDICIQDDSDATVVLMFNSLTGDYVFCCSGTKFVGKGEVKKKGGQVTLTHNPTDRRLQAMVSQATNTGTASLQAPPGTLRCLITDRNLTNNSCNCALPIN